MKYFILSLLLTIGLSAMLFGDVVDEVAKQKKQMEESGISQGDLAVEQGKENFAKAKGANGKTCSTCHGANGEKVKHAFTSMPKYYKDADKVLDLDSRIKFCLQKNMDEKKVEHKDDLVNLAFYVASLSNGQKIKTKASHAKEKEMYAIGEKLWYARAGDNDFSCSTCHEVYGGKRIRLQGLMILKLDKVSYRWPAYRFSNQENWTMEDRIQGCYKQMKMPKPAHFDETVTALSEYMMIKSSGAKVQIPGFVR